MDYQTILFEAKDKIARITLNKPRANIIDIQMLNEMMDAMWKVKLRKDINVVAIDSVGDRFSTGVSLQDHLPDKVEEMLPTFGKLFRMMTWLDQPTVAIVRGFCFAGAMELVGFCDMVIASETAKFDQREIALGGFAPLAVATYNKMMGRKKLMEFILLGETLDAWQAKEFGLVNRVVPDEKLEEEADKVLKRLASFKLRAIKANKRAIYATDCVGFEQSITLGEYIYMNSLARTDDDFEGIRAFLERRDPVWEEE